MIRSEEIDIDENDSLLGGNKNGSIYKARVDGRLVALKKLSSDASAEALQQIGNLWKNLEHPNVLCVLGISPSDEDPLYIVTELHPNMDVRRYLQDNPNFDRPNILLGTAMGMQYLHSRGLIHGGLKASEILIKDDGQACIADAGMTAVQASKNEDAHRYFSPEAWKGSVSRQSDVFAFAMCALEVFTSSPPWGILAEKHIYRNVALEDIRPDRPERATCVRVGLTDHIWNLIEKSWNKEARFRPSFDDIVNRWDGNDGQVRGDTEGNGLGRHKSMFSAPPPAYEASSASLHRSPATPANHPPRLDPRTFHGRSTTGDETRPRELAALHVENASSRSADEQSSFAPPRVLIPRRPSVSSSQASSASGSHGSSSAIPNVYPTNVTKPPMPNALQPFSAPPVIDTFTPPPNVGTNHATQLPVSAPSKIQLFRNRSYSAPASKLPGVKEEGRPYTSSQAPPIRQANVHGVAGSDMQSISDGNSTTGATNILLLVGALQAEVNEGRKAKAINEHLLTIYHIATESSKAAQRLVTGGVIPTLILLLKIRAVNAEGIEFVLMALGALAYDSISANMIYRTSAATTLFQLYISSISDEISTLSVWCLSRVCRSTDIANGLIKQGITKELVQRGLHGSRDAARHAAWCLGNLVHSDAIAELLTDMGVIPEIVQHLRTCSSISPPSSEDVSSSLFAVARISRSIKVAKFLAKAGAVELLASHLKYSTDSQILNWAARAVGCLMRPNSSDMSKILLDAGVARGLARLPSVLSSEEVEPLASFAFAIQRFSCAEWGGGTRKVLVEAGVVDSLLAALRTAADEPYPQVHIELALAVSFLGDVGGSAIRKEIINAGGVKILKKVGAEGSAEVAKACNMAATSIVGNIWTRNAASAKSAMNHNWSGGCPEYQPPCPEFVQEEQRLAANLSESLCI